MSIRSAVRHVVDGPIRFDFEGALFLAWDVIGAARLLGQYFFGRLGLFKGAFVFGRTGLFSEQ